MAEKPVKNMSCDERKSAGVNKKGEPRQHAEVYRVGASGVKKFSCGHTGKGKYCHTCANMESGLLDYDKDTDKYFVPDDHISHGKMAAWIKQEIPHRDWSMHSKQSVIDYYLTSNGIPLSELKKRVSKA